MALGSLEVTAQVATATHTAVEAIGETQAKIWGLDSCMAYAVEHATDVKREVVNARQRKQDYQKAVTDFLPSVAGGVQGQYAWGRNIDPETNTYNHERRSIIIISSMPRSTSSMASLPSMLSSKRSWLVLTPPLPCRR